MIESGPRSTPLSLPPPPFKDGMVASIPACKHSSMTACWQLSQTSGLMPCWLYSWDARKHAVTHAGLQPFKHVGPPRSESGSEPGQARLHVVQLASFQDRNRERCRARSRHGCSLSRFLPWLLSAGTACKQEWMTDACRLACNQPVERSTLTAFVHSFLKVRNQPMLYQASRTVWRRALRGQRCLGGGGVASGELSPVGPRRPHVVAAART